MLVKFLAGLGWLTSSELFDLAGRPDHDPSEEFLTEYLPWWDSNNFAGSPALADV